MPSVTPVPCRLDVPSFYEAPARYGLSALLLPLGLEPRFAVHDPPAVYYGVYPERSTAKVRIGCCAETLSYFSLRNPFNPAGISYAEIEGNRVPILFRDGNSEASMDPIASAFFWLSGWEEWVTPARDRHGRFPFSASLLSHLDAVEVPQVDVARQCLAARLAGAGLTGPCRARRWRDRPWAFLPTFDIDDLRKHRPGMTFANAKRHAAADIRSLQERLRYMTRRFFSTRAQDPWLRGLFQLLAELSLRQVRGTFALKCGGVAAEDSGYSPADRNLRRFVEGAMQSGHQIGLHPTYFSHVQFDLMRKERSTLRGLYGDDAGRIVRQHYLRYDIRSTPVVQEACGFEIDSTLGFAEREGFRRGTCLPYRVYDLVANRVTKVWELPLCFMDATLFNYRGQTLDESVAASTRLMEVCRRFGGVCVGLWHNTIFDETDYPGWGEHFRQVVDAAIERRALVTTMSDALTSWLETPANHG